MSSVTTDVTHNCGSQAEITALLHLRTKFSLVLRLHIPRVQRLEGVLFSAILNAAQAV